MFRIICSECGRDIDDIYQDNVSVICWRPLCEDCKEKLSVTNPDDERLVGREDGEDE